MASPQASPLCHADPFDGGVYCDANDIAGLLSGALDPVFKPTCVDPQANVVICRINSDNTPFNG